MNFRHNFKQRVFARKRIVSGKVSLRGLVFFRSHKNKFLKHKFLSNTVLSMKTDRKNKQFLQNEAATQHKLQNSRKQKAKSAAKMLEQLQKQQKQPQKQPQQPQQKQQQKHHQKQQLSFFFLVLERVPQPPQWHLTLCVSFLFEKFFILGKNEKQKKTNVVACFFSLKKSRSLRKEKVLFILFFNCTFVRVFFNLILEF